MIGMFAILQVALLGLVASRLAQLRSIDIASTSANLSSSICMIILSNLEHGRSPRPSILLSSYLFLTILFDITQTRTLWLASTSTDDYMITGITTAALGSKLLIALLESQPKTRWSDLDREKHSPEEAMGIYGLGAFIWLNNLFFAGYRKVLTMDDIYPLDSRMSSESLEERLARTMEKSGRRGRKFGIVTALFKTLGASLLIPVGPRVALVGFTFCQPFLINSILSYLAQPSETRNRNAGYGLIGATVIIYSGLAVSTALYWYSHERSMWMARGALTSAIFKKTVCNSVVIPGQYSSQDSSFQRIMIMLNPERTADHVR